MKFLNLGCGSHYHKEWTNIDFVSNSDYVKSHNLLDGIPYPNKSFDVVYHSHVLEHFSKKDGLIFLKECYRVLKTQGVIRIAVPNLEEIAREYLKNLQLSLDGDTQAMANYEWIKLELLDQMVRNKSGGEMKEYLQKPTIINESYVFNRIGNEGRRIRNLLVKSENKQIQNKKLKKVNKLKYYYKILKKIFHLKGVKKNRLTSSEIKALNIGEFRLGGEIHQWMYDRYSLTKILKEFGFEDIKICSAYESQITEWQSYELDVIGGTVRKPDSLFVEAIKK